MAKHILFVVFIVYILLCLESLSLDGTFKNIDHGLLWMFLFSFSPWVHFGTRPLLAYRGLLFMAHMNQHLRFARFHPQLLRLIILARSFASYSEPMLIPTPHCTSPPACVNSGWQ